ncbi:non-ribosomal peptide synthetase [Lentzea californiensis]|uniref:non-ribosomal peptide synthetase n=1 Tax=Lentzea californiensis TaxID=438851 RepID=UPI002165EDEC|nr:non-ribosomal peptide synthetase [Lentzea californiensis]MCR3750351.1 non-ribosomal peptide synthase domain TIGR01720/amino acid adenylation domain-containing protein [Lentzea californiensis]
MTTAPVTLLELTGAQLGIWHAQRLEPESGYYVVGDVVEITGAVDPDLLAAAVRATVEEAESLRLRVFDTPDGPRQALSGEPVPLPRVVDLRAEPRAAAEAFVTAERERVAAACREMTGRELFSHTVIRVSDDETWFTQLGHHLVFDGYTAAMIARRTAAHFTALTRGEEPPPCPFGRFTDVVAADLEYRASERAETDRAYWRERFTPLPEVDAASGSGTPGSVLTARAVLDAAQVARLHEVASAAGTTWGEVLISCYAAFLHRVLGRTDVVFALPLMCRTGVALRTPAMAVNVLPLRVDVRGHDRLDELSRRVATVMREMRAHQRYRGENLPRDVPGAGALLHGRGVNLKAFDLALDFAGAAGVMRNVAGGPPEDMGLSVLPTADGGLLLGFEVDARRHDQAGVDRVLASLLALADGLTGPDLPPVGAVELAGAEVLPEWATPAVPGAPADVPALLDSVAALGSATALVHGDERVGAAELVDRVRRAARGLRARGVRPDDVVALALPRSVDLVVGLLAVLEAGAAFQPLDLDHPAERLRELVADTKAVLTIGKDLGVPHVRLSELDGPEFTVDRSPEHLAYVIHTSGSTGRPKGVLGRVGGLLSLIHHHRATTVAETAGGRRLRVAHTYSFAFDSALDQLLWLLCGHELHLYDADTARDADALLAAYRRDRIDVVDTTPSLAGPLLDAGLLHGEHKPSLLVLGGEATPPALWRRVVATGVAARNMYGPTEASVDSTTARIDGDTPTIGHPVSGTRIYLLDNALRPVAAGASGELYVAGPHLARGYLGQPGVTAERFVADPFGPAGARMYRTGDIARWVPGRGLEFAGRRDGQVKIRGHRVELGEVEAVLGALPGVRAAAAAIDGTRLVGYVVGDLAPDEVREAMAQRVPDHLVPAVVVPLDALPVNHNGKLDRAALPAPRTSGGGRAPRTERERVLVDVVAEATGAAGVGVDDDFFALGGDSIIAIAVSSRLRAHGLELRPRDLLGRRTLASLAAEAREIGGTDVPEHEPVGEVPAPPIVRALLDPHPDGVPGYTQWTALHVDDLTLEALNEGVRAVVDHHDALRLRLTPGGLEIRPKGTSYPDVTESTEFPDTQLDPRTGDVLRVTLVHTADGDRLVIVAHHLVIDGVSWRVLLPDLQAACRGEALTPVGTSWRHHAVTLAEQGRSGARRHELGHWRSAHDGFRLGDRPLDPARDTVATAHRSTTTATERQSRAVLTALPAAYRAGVDEVLLAAAAMAFGTGRASVTLTVEGHGRELPGADLSRTVGWFTSEYPVRVPVDPDPGRQLRAAKEAKRTVPDNGIGYGVLRHLDPATRDEFRGPEVVLNHLGRFAPLPGPWRLPEGDAFAVTEPPAKALEQVLALNSFVYSGDRLVVEWTAAGDILPPTRVAQLQEAWDAALDALAAHADEVGDYGGLTPSDLPLVSLDQADIDALGRVEDVLPATALQAGLAFHSLVRGQDDADVYVVQAVTLLRGLVDVERMRAAAGELLRRNPALRVHLHTTAAGEVVQVVPSEVTLDFRCVDTGFEAEVRADQTRSFLPDRPPLIRFLLGTSGRDDHRLAITIHHALLDGWSMPIVGRALLAIYAELGGGPAVPAAPALGDYHRWLATRDHEAGLAAWREALSGLDDGTRLARESSAVARPERVTVGLGAEFSERLRGFARDRGVTPATVLQTAWGVLLGRLTGRRDVVFGCPVSGRPSEVDGVEAMIGQLGNTIPVRVRYEPGDAAADVLDRVHADSVALAEHHHVGLPGIQRAAGIGELFDTMLVMENFPLSSRGTETLAPGLDLAGVDIIDATHYPLTVIVLPGADITLGFGYQPSEFDEATVRGYGRWLVTLLRHVVDEPDSPIARLSNLDADEHKAVLSMSDGPEPKRERGGALEEFGNWVERTPQAEAVVCRNRSLTYAELDRHANRLANALLDGGVRPQDPVAVLLPRDVDMVVALFAVLKAGAVYVPMDPDYPHDRLAYMAGDIKPAAVIAHEAFGSYPLVRPDSGGADTDPLHARAGITGESLAYVIYTSGTTGKPKGVGIPHRGVPSLVALQEDVVGIGERERYLHFASTSFDVAFWQFMLPLLSGGTCVIAPEEVRVPGDELLDYIAEHRVTGVNLLPSFLAAMPDDRTVPPDVFFVVGAERLDPELARRWGARRALFNAYGPTEATINSVTWHYDPDDPGPLPIGLPDPEVRAYVLDGGLLPVGVGVTGELYLAGPKVARGYVNKPGLTSERFVADPFGPPGSRMYRTGDLVRWRADGQIVFLGRADHQVKVRGFRIELSEIETVLTQHPDVRACAVIVRDGRLVGYVIPTDDADLDLAGVRAYLATELPDHMVPAAFVELSALPLTPGGKLDRVALPAPELVATAAREPATPAETVLLRVFREVLGRADVQLDDSFLDVGGDSIVSLRLVSRARREGLELGARDVFEGVTVAGIAARCRIAEEVHDEPAVGDAPLSPVMHDLLRRGGDVARFCVWQEISVPAGGSAGTWRRVIDALLARHDVLRAHLAEGPVLRIPAPGEVTAADVFTHVTATDLRTAVDEHLARARQDMDLRTGPLLRAVWFDAGPDRLGRLLLVAHHMVMDALSWRVLVDDLVHAYEGNPLPRHGRSFLAWARNRRDEPPVPLEAPPAPLAVLDLARDTAATAVHHIIELDEESTRKVLADHPEAVLPTVLALAVGAWRGGEPDLLVALKNHGRTEEDAQSVGWFTTTRTARVRPPLPTIESVAAPAHLEFNYLGRMSAVPTTEVVWQVPPGADPLGSAAADDMPLPHPLMITAVEREGRLGVRFTWPAALFTPDEITSLGECLTKVVGDLP